MKCIRKECENEVPEGWEGGYCQFCIRELEQEEENRLLALEVEDSDYETKIEEWEDYGFDHSWER